MPDSTSRPQPSQSTDGHRRRRDSSSAARPEASTSGVPWITWVFGGAALLVVLTAGAVLLQGKKEKSTEGLVAEEPLAKGASLALTESSLAPPNPLDLTQLQVDAMARARVWSPTAMLASVEVVVEDGVPRGAVSFSFGESLGQPQYGAPLTWRRFAVEYEPESAQPTTRETQVAHPGIGLTEPNCPLDAAYRGLKNAGHSLAGTVGILLMRSAKHSRTVWMLTEASGASHPVDADTCTILRR